VSSTARVVLQIAARLAQHRSKGYHSLNVNTTFSVDTSIEIHMETWALSMEASMQECSGLPTVLVPSKLITDHTTVVAATWRLFELLQAIGGFRSVGFKCCFQGLNLKLLYTHGISVLEHRPDVSCGACMAGLGLGSNPKIKVPKTHCCSACRGSGASVGGCCLRWPISRRAGTAPGQQLLLIVCCCH
jgi:hypothetical protein